MGVEVPIRVVFDRRRWRGWRGVGGGGVAGAGGVAAAGASGSVAVVVCAAAVVVHSPLRGWVGDLQHSVGVAVAGLVDMAALRAAIADVVARHESLRTVFVEEEGVPFQRVLPVESVPMDRVFGEAVTVVEPGAVAGAAAVVAGYRFDLAERGAGAGAAVPGGRAESTCWWW